MNKEEQKKKKEVKKEIFIVHDSLFDRGWMSISE
jgi:hypothetical protein